MSLFDLFAFICIIAGAVVGLFAHFHEGVIPTLWGIVKGLGYGFAIYCITVLSIAVPLSLWLVYRPHFPKCRQGKCSDVKYRYLYLESEPPIELKGLQETHGGLIVQCQCGDLYLLSEKSRRFWEVTPSGALKPFKRYSPFGRWKLDEG